MTFTRVDLPLPFWPITAWISPGCTAKETWSSARVTPNDLHSPRTSSRAESPGFASDVFLAPSVWYAVPSPVLAGGTAYESVVKCLRTPPEFVVHGWEVTATE